MSGTEVALRDVNFRYGRRFGLCVPRLHVTPGSKLALIGPSGCGKSTLLNLMAGLLLPQSGSVEIDGVRVNQRSDTQRRRMRRERIGFVFQELALLDHLSVIDNVLLRWLLESPDRSAELSAEATRLAGALGIEQHMTSKPGCLSQGERQRVAILQALVGRPPLILADEPTGSLDPESAGAAISLMLGQVEELSTTLILVTHDHRTLARFDDVLDVSKWAEQS